MCTTVHSVIIYHITINKKSNNCDGQCINYPSKICMYRLYQESIIEKGHYGLLIICYIITVVMVSLLHHYSSHGVIVTVVRYKSITVTPVTSRAFNNCTIPTDLLLRRYFKRDSEM